jgi:catecholate siderophore receptor
MNHPARKKPAPSPSTPQRLLPLGALAAGFGLASLGGLAQAQTTAPTPTVPATNAAPAAAENTAVTGTLPVVRARASAERPGKDSVQATTTHIGKGTQELRDVPQSITVVTERLIDDRNIDTLKEALHNTAGISFQAAEGGEEDIRLRGFSLQSSGDIFVDGLRDPAFYERDTFNYDRLEVLRGSASMLFGRGSTGGAVNQVNKQPLLYGRSEAALTLGDKGYARATLDYNQRLGDSNALRVNLMKTAQDGNTGQNQDKTGLAASYSHGIGMTDEFSASVYYLKNDTGINYGLPWIAPSAGSSNRALLPVSPDAYYGLASDYNTGSAGTVTLSHQHRFGAGSELKTTLRAGRYERDIRASTIRLCSLGTANPDCPATTPTLETFNDATILTRGNPRPKTQHFENLVLQSDYSGRFKALGMKHQVAAGVDVNLENFTNYAVGSAASKPRTSAGSTDDGAVIDEFGRSVSEDRSFDSKALGVYGQDLVQIAPDWKLLAGLRWDRFSGRYNTPPLTGSTGTVTTATHRERSDSLWSQRLGALYQPTPFQSYHFSYGTSFNTSGDTYQYDALGSNTPPEKSVNYELGGKLDLADGRLSLRGALFYSVKKNERNRDAESVNATNYVLSGQRHAAGLELDLAGRITPAWEVFLSYAWIPDAEIDKGAEQVNNAGNVTCADCSLQGEAVGSRPGLTPEHSGTVWTTYQLSPRWRAGGGLNWRSAMAPQLITAFEAPGYVTADLMLEYTVGDLSYKFNLSNLSNKLYADMLYRGHYIPGKGRNAQLTASYRF